MTFKVTIILGLGFMSFCGGHYEFCWVIGISRLSFLSAILNWNFRLQTSDFKFQKSPLSFCIFK